MTESSRFVDSFIESQLQGQGDTMRLEDSAMAPGLYLLESYGNVGIAVTGEGVIVIDTGTPLNPNVVLERLRQITDEPVKYIIYTHGHADHAANALSILQEAARRGDARPHIIAHAKVIDRMNRYAELYGQNAFINRMQFRIPAQIPGFPPNDYFIRPDVTYETSMKFRLGKLSFELYHAMGETDDITWIYVPEGKAIFSGDLFVSSCPNIGNPLKVQRYEVEWTNALEQMVSFKPEVLGPGHGPILRGDAIEDALLTTTRALRYLHDEVVRRLNMGQWEEQIVNEVKLPTELAEHWAMAPIYGRPAYIVRAIYRRYAGWYDGNPSHLSPGRTTDIAAEVVTLAGNDSLLQRAEQLLKVGNYQMALHLADFMIDGTNDPSIKQRALRLKSVGLNQLAMSEPSYISRNILGISAERFRAEADTLSTNISNDIRTTDKEG